MPIVDPTDENVAIDGMTGQVLGAIRFLPANAPAPTTKAEFNAAPIFGYGPFFR